MSEMTPDSLSDLLACVAALTIRGFTYYDFAAEHYADFLRQVGASVAAGRIRYREDIVDGLENAPGASSECWRGETSASSSSGWQKPALFEVAERSVPSLIAEALAHAGRAGRAGVVLIDFPNDRRGA
jgi:hypothetical protein